MANRNAYIERVQQVVETLNKCFPYHVTTVPVHETFNWQTVWQGDVEVFSVDHPKARKAYAWSDADVTFTAVLGYPPATDPQNAVKVSIVAAAKKGKK